MQSYNVPLYACKYAYATEGNLGILSRLMDIKVSKMQEHRIQKQILKLCMNLKSSLEMNNSDKWTERSMYLQNLFYGLVRKFVNTYLELVVGSGEQYVYRVRQTKRESC